MKITDVALGRWGEILPRFGYHPPTNPKAHGPCPMCGGKDRFRFDDLGGRGTWVCNQCGHGDGFDLAGKLSGKNFAEVRQEVFTILGINPASPAVHRPVQSTPTHGIAFKRIWSRAGLAEQGGPVGMYLANRTGIRQPPKSIRYYQSFFNPTAQLKLPTMIAPVQSTQGEIVNLHCTFLTLDGYKANVDPAKRVLTGPLPDGCAIRLAPAHEVMGIAEGIETAISASRLFGVPVWAAVNGTMLSKWVPPAITKTVLIFADNDENYTGQSKAYALANRLSVQHKIATEVLIPPNVGDDWNDHHLSQNSFDGPSVLGRM